MRILLPFLIAVSSTLTTSCRTTPAVAAEHEVADLLAGSYTSAEQAKADPEFFEVHLHMARIWRDRDDGQWLYVEQAMSNALDKPYRQRIYCVTPNGDGSVTSSVFELPDAAARIGAWRDQTKFDGDSPQQLTKRDGCAIRLARDGDRWVGATNGMDCASTLRGAAYATSEVRLSRERIETWDRGFDKQGKQVWGAKKGAYVFLRSRT